MTTGKNKKLKILHLRSSRGMYGAENVILNLAKESKRMGIDAKILCINSIANPNADLVTHSKELGLDACSIDCIGLYDPQSIKEIRDIIINENFNIIHCHDYKACFFGLRATKGLKVKKVATNHLWTRATWRLRLYELLEGIMYNWFDKVIAVSEKIEHECRPFIIKKEKAGMIPNGIDCGKFAIKGNGEVRIENRKKLGLNENDIVIGNFARLSVEKNQECLLRALALLKKKIGNGKAERDQLPSLDPQSSIKLLFAGDGPERGNLEKLVEDLDLKDDVLFLGVRDDIPELFSAIDIYAQPSLREGLPMILLEAMAAGIPIVATDVGGVSTVIRHKETGFLIEPRGVDGLVDAVAWIIDNRKVRIEEIVNNAKSLVENEYSSQVMAKEYISVYNTLA